MKNITYNKLKSKATECVEQEAAEILKFSIKYQQGLDPNKSTDENINELVELVNYELGRQMFSLLLHAVNDARGSNLLDDEARSLVRQLPRDVSDYIDARSLVTRFIKG